MHNLALLDDLAADGSTTTWHIPATFGAIAGGALMYWFMMRGARAQGMLSGLKTRRRYR